MAVQFVTFLLTDRSSMVLGERFVGFDEEHGMLLCMK